VDFDQLRQLREIRLKRSVVRGSDLADRTPRTLVFGHTSGAEIFHCYLGGDGAIHVVVYKSKTIYRDVADHQVFYMGHEDGEGIDPTKCVPSKVAYPEACDFEFCVLLKSKGVDVPFPQVSGSRQYAGPFSGLTAAEVTKAAA
jgi:hypothetical protein